MLTKEKVLQKTSETQILKAFFPAYQSDKKKNYTSPFTDKDEKPSLSFYEENGHVKFKSHNTEHQGDIWQFIADTNKLDAKKDFIKVLELVNDKLNLGIEPQKNDGLITEFQPFTPIFLAFWNQAKISEVTLLKYNVKQFAKLQFVSAANGTKPARTYKFDYIYSNQIAACYTIHNRIKTYIPEVPVLFNNDINFRGQAKAFGFKNQNSSDIFGLAQLPPPPLEFVIFAAGEKDCLALNQHGFNAISLQSENQLPQEDLIKNLTAKSKYLLSCYDSDEAGKKASEKLFKTFGIASIKLPVGIKDAFIFFTKNSPDEFQKLVNQAIERAEKEADKSKNVEGSSPFHHAIKYLSARYKIRFNTVKKVFEYSTLKSIEYKEFNEDAMYVELQMSGVKIKKPDLLALLRSNVLADQYSPIEYYFSNLKEWSENEPDYIEKLSRYISTPDRERLSKHLKKWFLRSIHCSLTQGAFNKNALIFVHKEQNAGKTSFCRFLCPPALYDEYYAENPDPSQKDGLISLAKNFIINLDELKNLDKKDMNTIKFWITIANVNIRLPYAARNTNEKRIANFVGNTNQTEFLHDESGSVRFICIDVNGINHNYNNYQTGTKEIDINDVWAQAYTLYKQGERGELTKEEIEENENHNNRYKAIPIEGELLMRHFRQANATDENPVFMTPTEIIEYIQPRTTLKLNPVMMGKALNFCDFLRLKNSATDRYGYYVIQLTF